MADPGTLSDICMPRHTKVNLKPDRVFYQALCLFEHLRIYANAVNDLTVPYPAAALETEDPFFGHKTNGIEM